MPRLNLYSRIKSDEIENWIEKWLAKQPGIDAAAIASQTSWADYGMDSVTEIPGGRWDVKHYYDPDPDVSGKMYTQSGGFLEEVDRFDAQLFRISPEEAVAMDPQQRLLLEVSWAALEHAGLASDRLQGSQTGVFMGSALRIIPA